MDIHEYQAKTLLADNGVPVPPGEVAHSVADAYHIAERLGSWPLVLKAQVHAGGRGEAGGVKLVHDYNELNATAESMIGATLVTRQTGPAGKTIGRIYVETATDIRDELYLSILDNRDTGGATLLASAEGGVEIEELAENHPDKLIKLDLRPGQRLQAYHARWIASKLGFSGQRLNQAVKFLRAVNKAYIECDAAMVEINPWVIDGQDDFLALDGKMIIDDNALYRQRRINDMHDPEQLDPREVEATRHDLNYVKLDGNIGCMVNGAGLAMATMDMVKVHGGEPANFMDVAGAASPHRVAAALRLLHTDDSVKGILINIFGGMMRCNAIAEGIINAAGEIGLSKPLVVRLEGTNVDQGRQMLREANLPIEVAGDFDSAARKIVELVNGN